MVRICSTSIRALLWHEGIAAAGEIWLQTFPRVLGYVFNPVSFPGSVTTGRGAARGAGGGQQHLRRASPLPPGAGCWSADR
ncbi:MAG: DUF1365 family protein [Burkholderiales bacterium]